MRPCQQRDRGRWTSRVSTWATGSPRSRSGPTTTPPPWAAMSRSARPSQPPQSGDVIVSDDFGRTLSGSWGYGRPGCGVGPHGHRQRTSRSTAAAARCQRRPPRRPGRHASASRHDRCGCHRHAHLRQAAHRHRTRIAYVLARASGNNAYRAAIRVSTDGLVYAQLKQAVSNVEVEHRQRGGRDGLTITAGTPSVPAGSGRLRPAPSGLGGRRYRTGHLDGDRHGQHGRAPGSR